MKTLADLRDKVKPGFRFVEPVHMYQDRNWGPFNWEVIAIVERGVTAQMYYDKWQKACRGHIHLVEWTAEVKEV